MPEKHKETTRKCRLGFFSRWQVKKLIRTTFRKAPDTGEASDKTERIKCHTDREDLFDRRKLKQTRKMCYQNEDTLRKTQYSLSLTKKYKIKMMKKIFEN